jgi:hypothetical protein
MTLQRLQANQAWDKISENVLNSWVRQLELISSSVSVGDSRIAALSSSVSVINATAAFLAQANNFTAAQTISLSSGTTILTLLSSDPGATGPIVNIRHDSASPAANGVVAAFGFLANDDGGASDTILQLQVRYDDPAATSEDASFLIRPMIAGTRSTQLTVGTGVQVGSPTGGAPGAGSLNVDGVIQKDGTQVVSSRVTGWGDPFGAISRATFSTTTATTNQVAQALAALITDLKAHGLIGT